jgi:predicted amidohydrolase YtcJ
MRDPPSRRLVLHNGKIITVDARFSIAQAIALSNGRIEAVGSNADIAPLVDEHTRVIELNGRAVIPGLIDAHAHMDREGLKEALPSMAGVRSIDDILQRIEALVHDRKPGEWIVTMPLGEPPEFEGMPELLRERHFPTRHDLDRVAPDNPVFIRPGWGYWRTSMPLVGIANSFALRIAGILSDTGSPAPSLVIDADPSGNPTGVFREFSPMPICELTLMRAAPAFDLATRVRALARSMQIYNSFGTTSVFEGHGVAGDLLAAYQQVRTKGPSVRATLLFSPAWRTTTDADIRAMISGWGRWLAGRGLGDDWLRVQGLFTEVDTSLEHELRRAAYPNTGWAGFNYAGLPHDAVKTLLTECARNGIRVEVIGASLLGMIAEVARVAPIDVQRWVVAHITTLDQREIDTMRDLGLIVTTHSNAYIYKGGAALRDSVGAAREDDVVPLRRLIDAGVPVALATDNVPVSLWQPIWQVVARVDRTINAPIACAQALRREEALRCATMGGAYLTFDEARKGSLEPGKLADAVVLSQDPLTCDLGALRDTVAEVTIVDGEVVFDRNERLPN